MFKLVYELGRNLVTKSLRRQLGSRQIVFMWRKGRRLPKPVAELVETIRQR